MVAHFRGIVKSIFKKDFESRRAAKKASLPWHSPFTDIFIQAEEARIRVDRLVGDLIAVEDFRVFLEKLQGFPSRSAPGYNTLEAGLLDLSRVVPDRLSKLEVILLGKFLHLFLSYLFKVVTPRAFLYGQTETSAQAT